MMELTIQRIDLARRAFARTEQAWAQAWVRERESYVRERVLARAKVALLRPLIEKDAPRALRLALSRHEQLLSGFEIARAHAWIKHTDASIVQSALVDLLFGKDSLYERAKLFLQRTQAYKIDAHRTASINETVASYLLAMHDPHSYAFAKPERALQPAYRLLVDPSGVRVPKGPERLIHSTRLYTELRDIWRADGFEGDLLDVHTRLCILGGSDPVYAAYNWASALRAEDVAWMVSSVKSEEMERWRESTREAGILMRQSCFDRSLCKDPYHGISIDEYAYLHGTEERTMAWIVEHGARDLARVHLKDASSFGVSGALDGSWRIGKQDGVSRLEAEAFFETRIKPKLREIARIAQDWMAGEPLSFEVLAMQHARALDAKILLLTLCAYDPEWMFAHATALTRHSSLRAAAALIGLELPEVETFSDYVQAQLLIDARLDAGTGNDVHARLDACAYAWWLEHHVVGKMMLLYAVPTPELDAAKVPAQDQDTLQEGFEEGFLGEKLLATLRRGHWDDFIHTLGDTRLEEVARLVRARKNVVLYGPPGTGKTILSTRLAERWRHWQGDSFSCVEQVTFHPSYGYEEFIEGFRPCADEPGAFTLQDGILMTIAAHAMAHPERQFLLLIDELNRGDVARIFGELITLIEADKRTAAHARRTMLSRKELFIPPNVYVLGTMNTADKSISLIDVAVRRRFAFKHIAPDPSLLDRHPGIVHEVCGVRLAQLLEVLNDRLDSIGVFPERFIGHAFLWMRRDEVDDALEALADRFRLDIIPLVEEYCFADRSKMREVLGNLVDSRGMPNERCLEVEAFVHELQAMTGMYE